MRKRLIAALMVASFGTVLGGSTTASAYCDTSYDGCSNSCVETAKAYHKVTGRPAPWYCPM